MADWSKSVIDVAEAIHDRVRGFADLVVWLEHRVEQDWDPSLDPSVKAYDDAVRAMARAAVAEGQAELERESGDTT
jgi:hypothetical protein